VSNLYTIAKDYAEQIIGECETLEDAQEMAWEVADSSEDVIYYGRAWDLVASNRADCEDAADDLGLDLADAFSHNGIDGVMTSLAFAGLYAAICRVLQDAARCGRLDD
jgi:hypothetical protein